MRSVAFAVDFKNLSLVGQPLVLFELNFIFHEIFLGLAWSGVEHFWEWEKVSKAELEGMNVSQGIFYSPGIIKTGELWLNHGELSI